MKNSGITHQMLLNSIKTPVVALNRDWKVIYCNNSYLEFFGGSIGDIEGQNLLEVFPSFVATDAYVAILKVLETGRPRKVEGRARGRWVSSNIYGIPDGVICIVEDITERVPPGYVQGASDADYRAIFNEVNDALIICDVHTGMIMDANDRACDLFGYSRHEILKLNVADMSSGDPPYSKENAARWIKKMADSGETRQVEWNVRDKNGRSFWIDFKSKPLEFEGEQHLLAVVRDVTKEKLMQKALRDHAERFQDLFEKAQDLIFMHDLEGRFLNVNSAAERLTGFWRGELLRMNISDLMAPEYETLIHNYLHLFNKMAQQRQGKNKPMNWELGIKTKHGSLIYLEINTWLVYKNGEPVGVQGIARDISVHKNEQEQLKDTIRRLSAMLYHHPDATLGIDPDGHVIVWNKAMEELTGIPGEEILGKGEYEYALAFYGQRRPILVDFMLNPDEVEKFYPVTETENYVRIGEIEVPSLKGSGHVLWGQAVSVYDDDGILIGALESLRDMTQQNRMKEMADKPDQKEE